MVSVSSCNSETGLGLCIVSEKNCTAVNEENRPKPVSPARLASHLEAANSNSVSLLLSFEHHLSEPRTVNVYKYGKNIMRVECKLWPGAAWKESKSGFI